MLLFQGKECSLSETASVLFCLHLLYEDLKLDVNFWSELSMMAKMLAMLSADLQLEEYLLHYWQDFPLIVRIHFFVISEIRSV